MKEDLEAGMRISVFVPQTDEQEIKSTQSLTSIVEEVVGDEYILMQIPTYRGLQVQMPEEPVVIRFFCNTIPYTMQVEYVENEVREGLVLAKMRRVTPPERHQLREHFRLSCHLPAVLRCNEPEGGEEMEYKCSVLDLSEGGMMILTNAVLEADEEVLVLVAIGSSMKLESKVLRVTEVTEGIYQYKVGLRFKGINSAQADAIYKYIVDAQLAKRRTRRG